MSDAKPLVKPKWYEQDELDLAILELVNSNPDFTLDGNAHSQSNRSVVKEGPLAIGEAGLLTVQVVKNSCFPPLPTSTADLAVWPAAEGPDGFN